MIELALPPAHGAPTGELTLPPRLRVQAMAQKLARVLWPRLLTACRERRSGAHRAPLPTRLVVGWREGYASLGSDGSSGGGGSMHTATSPWPPALSNALSSALSASHSEEAAEAAPPLEALNGTGAALEAAGVGNAAEGGNSPATMLALSALRTLRGRLSQVRWRNSVVQ